MANNTVEYWDINGVSLCQYGWSVTTFGGARYDLPPRRGDNIQLAYRPGARHRNKLPDQRQIDLAMFLTGTDPATGQVSGDQMLRFNDSWDFIRRMVWQPNGTQVTLTRRWLLTVDGVPTVVMASALAEVTDTMAPTMTGRHRADFTMSLKLADPYFYGPTVVTPLAVGQTATVTNLGNDVAAFAGVQIDLVGPLTNPKILNATPDPNVWVQYTGDIIAGQTLSLNMDNFTALQVANMPLPSPPLTVSFVANANGRYVTAEAAGVKPLIANRVVIGLWEQFELVQSPYGSGIYFALQSHVNGMYVTAENAGALPLIANRSSIGPWESFDITNYSDGTISLSAVANDKFVTAENGGASSLIANRSTVGPWEKFTLVNPEYQAGSVIGGISHGGAYSWMGLLPGDNTITFTADGGTGTAILRFNPPYV